MIVCAAGLARAWGEFAEFPVCTQRVEVAFADAAAAVRATATVRAWPEGCETGFSCRWDDANPRHAAMADMLDPLGVRATFYFNGRAEGKMADLVRDLVRRGHSIGSHTVTHDWLPRLKSTTLFREILENRIRLEVASQSPVNVFGLPYSSAGSDVEPDQAHRVGQALANAGFIGGAEGRLDQSTVYGLDPARWFGTALIRPNDRNPDRNLYVRGLAAATNLVLRDMTPYRPHVALGVHTWQTDEGLRQLSQMLKESVVRDGRFWFANENACLAARFQARNAAVRKVGVTGNRAVFEIVRPEPFALGADVPPVLAFSERPTERVDVPTRGMPSEYVLREGVFKVSPELNVFETTFVNDTGKDLSSLEFFFRLPPGFNPGVARASLDRLAAGASKKLCWTVSRVDADWVTEGDLYAALQTDAVAADGRRLRFWEVFDYPRAKPSLPVPRDRTLVLGPLPKDLAPSADALAKMSVPGARPADVPDDPFGRWVPPAREAKSASFAVDAYPAGRFGEAAKRLASVKTGMASLVMADFRADPSHGDVWRIFFAAVKLCFSKEKPVCYLNGRVHDMAKPFRPLPGVNRLIVKLVAGSADQLLDQLAIRSEKDGAAAVFLVPSVWQIVQPDGARPHEVTAADELSAHLARRVRGELTVEGRRPVVFHVGDTAFARAHGLDAKALPEEAWRIRSFGRDVVLVGGGTRGTLYAVWHFLEDFCDVRWWSQVETEFLKTGDLTLGKLEAGGKPAFVFRDLYTGMHEPDMTLTAARHRLNGVEGGNCPLARELGGGFSYGSPGASHTFDFYIPAAEHMKAHPAWFSYRKLNGTRVGGDGDGQLCLTHPEVRARMKARLREYIRADRASSAAKGVPAPYVYDISENDNWNYCECDACEAAKAKWGMSGLMLDFVNDIAASIRDDYPETLVNTFAYHGTEKPPTGGKRAADNVMVRVCDTKTSLVTGHFETGNTLFSEFLADWAKAAKHISVWDYAITYTDELTGFPLPNERHIAELFRYGRDRHVFGFFWEQERPHKSDFWELKFHLLTKLLENPDLDAGALERTFLKEYYGPAAEKIAAYRQLLDRARRANGGRVGWFPELKDWDWVDAATLDGGQTLLAEAEAAVAGDRVHFPRVRHARCGLDRLVCLRAQRSGRREAPECRGARARLTESWPKWMRSYPEVTEKGIAHELEMAFGQPPPSRFAGRDVSDFPGLFFTCTDTPPRTMYLMSKPKAWRCDLKTDETFAKSPVVLWKNARGEVTATWSLPSPQGTVTELAWCKLGTVTVGKGDALVLRPDGRLTLTFEHRPELIGSTRDVWIEVRYTGKGFEPGSTEPPRIWIARVVLAA